MDHKIHLWLSIEKVNNENLKVRWFEKDFENTRSCADVERLLLDNGLITKAAFDQAMAGNERIFTVQGECSFPQLAFFMSNFPYEQKNGKTVSNLDLGDGVILQLAVEPDQMSSQSCRGS
ncbi:MAG: hypothetical protein ACRD3W_24500 [Terriglobales bacterium]